MNSIIQQNNKQILTLCNKYHVARLFAFGSVTNNNFNSESDIDLMVELLPIQNPVQKGETLYKLWDEFEILFGRKVDLVSSQPIKNKIFSQQLNATKQLIYERVS